MGNMAVARRLRRSTLLSSISFALAYFIFTLSLFRYDWVDQSTGSTIFHHQNRYLLCLKARLQFEGPRNSLSKVSSKLKCLTTQIPPRHSLSHAFFLSGDVELNPGMTDTTKPDERRNTKASIRCEGNIIIAHLNACSIKNRNNFIFLKDVVRANKFDILIVSETWLDSSVSNFEIGIPGYSIFPLDRLDKVG